MMTLDLLSEIDRLQDGMNHLFSRSGWSEAVKANVPALNVWAGEEALVVTADLPGIDVNQMEVSVHGNQLTLKGSYPRRELKEGERWIRQERPDYSFVRTLQLPFQVETGKVDAAYGNGVLTLTFPRAEAEKPKRIQIKAAA